MAPRIVLVLFTLAINASLGHGTRDSCVTSVGVKGGVIVSYAVRHGHRTHTNICTVVKDAYLALIQKGTCTGREREVFGEHFCATAVAWR